MEVYDNNRRPILVGDTLKVFHFTGARRKKYYMYKFVVEGCEDYLTVSHLNREGETYRIYLKGQVLSDYEIVQGYCDGISFEDRERLK